MSNSCLNFPGSKGYDDSLKNLGQRYFDRECRSKKRKSSNLSGSLSTALFAGSVVANPNYLNLYHPEKPPNNPKQKETELPE